MFCLSIDIKGIINLGPKALIMFFAATLGIIIGGPLALWLVGQIRPDVFGGDAPDALWRGLSACVVREAIYTAGYLGLAPIATESLVKSVDYFKARFVCSLFYTTTPWFRSRRAATFRDSS